MADFFFPSRGGITLQEIINYLKQQGALNKKYDPNLDGVIDLAENALNLGGLPASDYQLISQKGQPFGYCPLNASAQVPPVNLPPIPLSKLLNETWELIGYVSGTGLLSFTGIDGVNDRLYMVLNVGDFANGLTGANIIVRFNNDTGTDYVFTRIYANPSTTVAKVAGGTGRVSIVLGAVPPGFYFSSLAFCKVYSASKVLVIGFGQHACVTVRPQINYTVGMWTNPTPTAGITSLQIGLNAAAATQMAWLFKKS